MTPHVLVIHGGARVGNLAHTARAAEESLTVLSDILRQSFPILSDGGNALESVINAVRLLEDCPYFNAGKGSVLAANGSVEMDASIMDGNTGRFGGVTNVKIFRNPVLAARMVMEKTPHAIMCGDSLGALAAEHGLEVVDNAYFITDEQRAALLRALETKSFQAKKALSTVGAVALDRHGNLAAATSTGGLTAKLPGRVSDSSIAGAGTWASNDTCAISCTGTGDVFIRNATARDAACLMEYKSLSLVDACRAALQKVKECGGIGGMIGVDNRGNIAMPYNTSGMFRGYMRAGEEPFTALTENSRSTQT